MGAHVPFDPEELLFMNNFYTRFPLGNTPNTNNFPEGLHRSVSRMNGYSVTNRANLQKNIGSGFEDEADLEDYCRKYSDKYLGQTPEQFYAEFDVVMRELGIEMSTISIHLNVTKHRERLLEVSPATFTEELEGPLRPIYQALRERGYNKAELWVSHPTPPDKPPGSVGRFFIQNTIVESPPSRRAKFDTTNESDNLLIMISRSFTWFNFFSTQARVV